jgi:hypothetical protein
MTTNLIDSNINDATHAVEEVSMAAEDAELLVSQISDDSHGAPSISRELREQSMRERAKKEREKGVANLKKRHAGVNVHIRRITINERVAGAAFERFFHVIENSIYTITRRGEMFVGKDACKQIMDTVEKNIVEMESQIATDRAQVDMRLSVYKSSDDFLQTTYTAPAAVHDVEFRTKLSLRVAELFIGQDQIIAGQQALHWNGDIDLSIIEDQERKLKKELRKLTTFFARTLRGMNNIAKQSAEPTNDVSEELKAAA